MTFALGTLGWTPREFWESTFYEISCAYVGHSRANGTGFQVSGWTDSDWAEYEAMRKRFPDDPPTLN